MRILQFYNNNYSGGRQNRKLVLGGAFGWFGHLMHTPGHFFGVLDGIVGFIHSNQRDMCYSI